MQTPIISGLLVQLFLGFVHAFTVFGIEAQAIAYPCEKDSVNKVPRPFSTRKA